MHLSTDIHVSAHVRCSFSAKAYKLHDASGKNGNTSSVTYIITSERMVDVTGGEDHLKLFSSTSGSFAGSCQIPDSVTVSSFGEMLPTKRSAAVLQVQKCFS